MQVGAASLLFGCLLFHALEKRRRRESLLEFFWCCHVASIGSLLSVLLDLPHLTRACFLFHLGVGFPSWVFDLIFGDGLSRTVSGILTHLIPLFVGFSLTGRRGDTVDLFLAFAIYPVMWLVSRFLLPKELNVNLVHKQPFLKAGPIAYFMLNLALSIPFLFFANRFF